MKKPIDATTLAYPVPAFAVATYDAGGKPNVMTAAWGGICCSKPPCIAVALRKATHSYASIVEREAFTVNIASENQAALIDYVGLVSGKNVDKFAAANLTPVKSELVDAPFVMEFPVNLECKLIKTIEIGSHTQFIGEIVGIQADEEVLDDEDSPDIEKIKPILFGLPLPGAYYGVGKNLGRAFSIGKELKEKA